MTAPDPDGLAQVTRRLLPALNIQPDSLRFDPGVTQRARRRPPWTRSLDGVRKLLVYVGPVAPDQAAPAALAALSAAARAECEQLLVVWEDAEHGWRAAAYAITAEHEIGRLLGTSWTDPASWADPMIDPSLPVDDILAGALDRLRTVIVDERDFGDALERALRVTEVALRSAGGEGQDTSDRPDRTAAPGQWSSWLDRYESSVRDEWRRVGGKPSSAHIRAVRPTATGPLSDVKVFLSYARPDATAMARPVLEALRSQGAQVWFDQDEPLDAAWLDAGLAGAIEACDAYVLCASNEFFERAGYATQEVAWAIEKCRGSAPLRSIVAVGRPDTVLPTILVHWPAVTLIPAFEPVLGEMLARSIGEAADLPIPAATARPGGTGPALLPPLDLEADTAVLIARTRHRERLRQVPNEAVVRIAGTSDRDAHDAQVADRLRHVGADLDWDGTLGSAGDWPDDPLLRGYRWMLGCSRVFASVRWPLSGDLEDPDDIAPDLELIATRPIPVLAWPAGACWGDEERRLVLRFHLSTLRGLAQLLSAGLWGGLLNEPAVTLDRWTEELPRRRREVLDALMSLRLAGGLSWRGDPPIWDYLYGDWHRMLSRGQLAVQPMPVEVRTAIAAQVGSLSAVAAQVTCHSARNNGSVAQTFGARGTTYRVWAGRRYQGDSPGRCIVLGLDGEAVSTRWSGFDGPDGAAAVPAPEALRQAMNFARA